MTLALASHDCDPWPTPTFGSLVGPSLTMRALFARLERIAACDSTVLVQGETGTGKELVARAVHERSRRAGQPFVIVDCGALPEALLEAELFGHARGAFTDAHAARPGAIEAAQGGTVFLDEIGELPPAMQPRLLRVLEARTVKRLGENGHRPVDVRFVFATHRNLEELVARRLFREDLYFRLAVLAVRVPPLRERPDDIPALAERLLGAEARRVLTPAVLRELSRRAWPGNVRELRNVLERIAALGPGEGCWSGGGEPSAETTLRPEWAALSLGDFRARAFEELERAYLVQLLARHQGRIADAAADAAVHRTHLYRLVRRHGL